MPWTCSSHELSFSAFVHVPRLTMWSSWLAAPAMVGRYPEVTQKRASWKFARHRRPFTPPRFSQELKILFDTKFSSISTTWSMFGVHLTLTLPSQCPILLQAEAQFKRLIGSGSIKQSMQDLATFIG
jgi:hypothetical protein